MARQYNSWYSIQALQVFSSVAYKYNTSYPSKITRLSLTYYVYQLSLYVMHSSDLASLYLHIRLISLTKTPNTLTP